MENEGVRVETEKLQAIIEMAGAVCHELNQPLQSIYGYCETKKLMRVKRYETKDYLKGKVIDNRDRDRDRATK
jgi:C4-dicarboxylate-specific signal transduction histidine kinase